jgi:hypothetical protein
MWVSFLISTSNTELRSIAITCAKSNRDSFESFNTWEQAVRFYTVCFINNIIHIVERPTPTCKQHPPAGKASRVNFSSAKSLALLIAPAPHTPSQPRPLSTLSTPSPRGISTHFRPKPRVPSPSAPVTGRHRWQIIIEEEEGNDVLQSGPANPSKRIRHYRIAIHELVSGSSSVGAASTPLKPAQAKQDDLEPELLAALCEGF